MQDKPNDLLLLGGRVLTLIAQGITALAAVVSVIIIPIILIFSDTINAELVAEHGASIPTFPAIQIALIMALAAAAFAVMFQFFRKLRHIIDSVSDGEPFAPENSDRLTAMGWLMLALYPIQVAVVAVAASLRNWIVHIEDASFDIDFDFGISSILIIVILFILARVFRHGAAMREDLEGTV